MTRGRTPAFQLCVCRESQAHSGLHLASVHEFMKGRSSYACSMDEGTEGSEGTTVPARWPGRGGCGEGRFVWPQLRADGRLAGAAPGQTPGSPAAAGASRGRRGAADWAGLAAAAARREPGVRVIQAACSASRETAGLPEQVRPAPARGCAQGSGRRKGPGSWRGSPGSRPLPLPGARWALQSPRLGAPQSARVREPCHQSGFGLPQPRRSLRCRQRR